MLSGAPSPSVTVFKGLKDDTISVKLHRHGRPVFRRVPCPNGVTFDLIGAGNDYVGKGLSGGRIVVRPPEGNSGIGAA